MANPYSGEWIKINTIANDVRALQDRIAELQNAAAQLQADINSVPEVTDEEGNDVNAEQRNALNAQLESVKASIDEANGQRERLGSQARALARQYQTEARAYEEKARHTSNATAVFNNISNYRFGARMASANAQVTKQREQHYQSYVNILNALVIAAQNAANGITPSGSEQSVADRGTFHNSHSTSGGAHKSGEKGNRQNYQRGWNGIPGESQKIADQNESKALLNNLGVEGIPYKNGQPDFSTVAHAAVPTDDSAALLTCADAMLAAKYGVSADEIAAYRKENGLEWRGNENGEATLIPQCIGDEYLEGRVENQEKSAKDALTAYMSAHNYGKDDYETYSKDPEWYKLHKRAFPEDHINDGLSALTYSTAFISSERELRNTEKLASFVNSLEGSDKRVINLYNNIGNIDHLQENGISFNITHNSNHYVWRKGKENNGKMEVDSIELSIPELSGENITGQVQTTLHEQMHLIDYLLKDDVKDYDAPWFTAANKEVVETVSASSAEMSEEIRGLFQRHDQEVKELQHALEQQYYLTIDKANRQLSKDHDHGAYNAAILKASEELKSKFDYGSRNLMGGGVGQLEDIYDALSSGQFQDSRKVLFGHGSVYYTSNEAKIDEIIANYASLSVTRPDLVSLLKQDKPQLVTVLDSIIDLMNERIMKNDQY